MRRARLRAHVALCVALGAAGCGEAGTTPARPAEPARLVRRLDGPRTALHVDLSRAQAPSLRHAELAELVTKAFVRDNPQLFALRSADGELQIVRRDTDELGMTHARFQQVTHGIPVAGAELSVHYDRDGRLTSLDANYVPDLDDVDPTPSVPAPTDDAALEVFVPAAKAATDRARPRLVWSFTIRDLEAESPAIWKVRIDATTGEEVDRYNALTFDTATAPGVLGQPQTFEVTEQSGVFTMIGAVDDVLVRTFTASNKTERPGTIVSSSSLTSWDPVAVDAHAYTLDVIRYYKERHQRNSIDGVGGALVSTVHYGKNYNNAFWDGRQMTYGDGDGVKTRAYSASPDIVAHELTHGVTERTSKLEPRGESGALNEAISDIMGAFFAHYVKPDPVNNWVHGLEKQIDLAVRPPARNLADPGSIGDPTHVDEKRTDAAGDEKIHANSNIISHAAYLMTVGGTHARSNITVPYGIGWEKSERLWYRANAKYWLTRTGFAQAAAGVLAAAKDLELSDNEQNIVECAFKAVGVIEGECASIHDPSAAPADATSASVEAASNEDDEPSGAPFRRRAGALSTSGCSAVARTEPSSAAVVFALGVVAALSRRRRRGGLR